MVDYLIDVGTIKYRRARIALRYIAVGFHIPSTIFSVSNAMTSSSLVGIT